jgi:hypothetical protein
MFNYFFYPQLVMPTINPERIDSLLCTECQQEPESVLHILKFCPVYRAQQLQLQYNFGQDIEIDLSLLLDRKRLPLVFKYLETIGCFADMHRSLIEDLEDEQQAQPPNRDNHQDKELNYWV